MKPLVLCLILISCASRTSLHPCEVKSSVENKILHWTLSGKEITIPDTQFFIQKKDKSYEVITAHFKFHPDMTYRYSPSEGDMSGPESFEVKSDKPVQLIAEISLKEIPVDVVTPKFYCR